MELQSQNGTARDKLTVMQPLTKNQALVLSVLEKSHEPVSAYTILERLRDDGFRAPLQVYRALDKLLATGKVHRLESINAFVACSHTDHSHSGGSTIFAICESCGRVDEFHDELIGERLRIWERASGFKPEKTTIEIRGFCSLCRPGTQAASVHNHAS
jgi:Fur family transcriptional regulator, zinc uptake regulator